MSELESKDFANFQCLDYFFRSFSIGGCIELVCVWF